MIARPRRVAWFSFVLAAAVADARPVGATERPPVVFAHGLGISGDAYELLQDLKGLFDRRSRRFLIAKTPVAGSIQERAEVLKSEIARLVPVGKLHLVGHSMGGLDARLALQDDRLAERVVSLTTLSTPHRGSPVADYVVRHLDGMEADSLLRKILETLFAGDLRAARQMTTWHMNGKFNAEVVDDPRVRYFSMGFYVPRPVMLHSMVPTIWAVHSIGVAAGFALNDGMVSVESARWGQDLGVFAGDHYSETSPIPLVGGPGYLEIFGKVLANIETRLE